MASLTYHMKNVIYNNYDPYREPLKVKFQMTQDRSVDNFIGFVDGYTKSLICQGIVGLIDELESWQALENLFLCRPKKLTLANPKI